MPAQQTTGDLLALMDSFLKSAREGQIKDAAPNLDAGADSGSSHPSAKVDDGTEAAREGARSAENEADVKKYVPDTINSPDAANKPGASANFADTAGTQSMASDDPLKGNAEPPKKDHSRSMSDAGPGDQTFTGNYDKAASAADLLKEANTLLESVAALGGEAARAAAPAEGGESEAGKTGAGKTGTEGGEAGAGKTEDEEKQAAETIALYKQAAEQYPQDVEAGYIAAALLAEQLGLGQSKEAREAVQQRVATTVDAIRKEAQADAEAYVQFLSGYAEGIEKSARGEAAVPAAPAALAEGAGAEEEEEPSDEDAVEAIAELLDEAGISAEDLAAALEEAQEGGGEGEGGAEAGGGGEIPPEALAALAGGGGQVTAASSPGTVKTAASGNREALKQLAARYISG